LDDLDPQDILDAEEDQDLIDFKATAVMIGDRARISA
jgi:hypothetical protein